jgi:hypothetical protein
MLDLDDKIIETGDLKTIDAIQEQPGKLYWVFMFGLLFLPFLYLNFFR